MPFNSVLRTLNSVLCNLPCPTFPLLHRPPADFHFCTCLGLPAAPHFTGVINSSELSVTTMVTVPELARSDWRESVLMAM